MLAAAAAHLAVGAVMAALVTAVEVEVVDALAVAA